MGNLHRTYGDTVALLGGGANYLFVFSPEGTQAVLTDTTRFFNIGAESSPLRIPRDSALARLLGGLSQMNGDRHRQQRALIAPALQRRYLPGACRDVADATNQMLKSWQPGQRCDLFAEMKALTLAIAMKAFLGVDLSREGRAVSHLLQEWTDLVFSIPVLLLPFDIPGFPYRRLIRVSSELEALVRSIVTQKRERQGSDVLSRLLTMRTAAGESLTEDELIGHTNFLFMAGHATTACALTSTLLLLSQHPAVLSDVVAELSERCPQGTPSADQIDDLPILSAVVKESLRLLPPVLWWARVATAPFAIGGHTFAAGTRVVHSAFVTHRDPARFPEPKRFRPERWSTAAPSHCEYLPFSAGPRACLGASFAIAEVKLVIAMILRSFRVTIPPGTRVDITGPMLAQPRAALEVVLDRSTAPALPARLSGSIRRLVELPA